MAQVTLPQVTVMSAQVDVCAGELAAAGDAASDFGAAGHSWEAKVSQAHAQNRPAVTSRMVLL